MKVRELIEELENFDDDMEVHFSYNYGDHWRTQVAPVAESVDECEVIHSDYHNMPRLTDDGETLGRASAGNSKTVVVISA